MTPEEARLDAIERRLEDLSERLARLESPRRIPMPAPVAAPVPRPSEPPVPLPMPPPPQAPEAPPQRRLETAVGLTWISRVAVVTVVLALAFFFEYAFENHWIDETARVLLGIVCGAAALLFGEILWRKGQRAYAQSLTAAGVAFFYLSVWAAFALYHLIAQPVAFGAMLLDTAAAGALALRYDAPAVAMLGLAGGYATPLLLGSAKNSWFVLAYALVLDAGAVFLARARAWKVVEWLAVVGTAILYLNQTPAEFGTIFLIAYYALFAVSRQMPVAAAAQLLAGVALTALWPGVGGMALAWMVAAAGLGVADRRGWALQLSASFAGFWLAYALWRGQSATPPAGTFAVVTGAFLMFLGWPLWRTIVRGRTLGIQDLLVSSLNAAFYFGTSYGLLRPEFTAFEGLFAVAVAVLEAAVARLLWSRDQRGSLFAAGAAWVLLVLAAPIQFAGYHITVAWAVEAAAVVWIGTRFGERKAVHAAMAVFVMVVSRLAMLDGHMYPNPAAYEPLFNARFLTFAVAAAALWAAAWWIREGNDALATYIAGHAVMLWGLSLEAAGWAARSSAPQNLRSVTSTSISVLAAGYAVLLVAVGASRGHAVTRITGIVLIGFVVVKLYLYDVWLLGQFYRMAAFAILGVLLLTMSYLYSRRRV